MKSTAMEKIIIFTVMAILFFLVRYMTADIFSGKPEVIRNNKIPAYEFLLKRGTTLPKNIEKGNIVYQTIVVSTQELSKKMPDDLLWISSFGKENLYFLFTHKNY